MKSDTQWPMWMNDVLGCCTISTVCSAVMTWTSVAQSPIITSDLNVVNSYMSVSGYKIGNPSTDNGAVVDTVLDKWLTTGLIKHGVISDYLSGRCYVTPSNLVSVKQAIYFTGGIYLGLNLPNWAVNQDIDWKSAPNRSSADEAIAGGHAVWVHGFDENWLYLNTWGRRKRMTYEFFLKYCDEAHALVSRLDWTNTKSNTPLGMSIEQVRSAVMG